MAYEQLDQSLYKSSQDTGMVPSMEIDSIDDIYRVTLHLPELSTIKERKSWIGETVNYANTNDNERYKRITTFQKSELNRRFIDINTMVNHEINSIFSYLILKDRDGWYHMIQKMGQFILFDIFQNQSNNNQIELDEVIIIFTKIIKIIRNATNFQQGSFRNRAFAYRFINDRDIEIEATSDGSINVGIRLIDGKYCDDVKEGGHTKLPSRHAIYHDEELNEKTSIRTAGIVMIKCIYAYLKMNILKSRDTNLCKKWLNEGNYKKNVIRRFKDINQINKMESLLSIIDSCIHKNTEWNYLLHDLEGLLTGTKTEVTQKLHQNLSRNYDHAKQKITIFKRLLIEEQVVPQRLIHHLSIKNEQIANIMEKIYKSRGGQSTLEMIKNNKHQFRKIMHELEKEIKEKQLKQRIKKQSKRRMKRRYDSMDVENDSEPSPTPQPPTPPPPRKRARLTRKKTSKAMKFPNQSMSSLTSMNEDKGNRFKQFMSPSCNQYPSPFVPCNHNINQMNWKKKNNGNPFLSQSIAYDAPNPNAIHSTNKNNNYNPFVYPAISHNDHQTSNVFKDPLAGNTNNNQSFGQSNNESYHEYKNDDKINYAKKFDNSSSLSFIKNNYLNNNKQQTKTRSIIQRIDGLTIHPSKIYVEKDHSINGNGYNFRDRTSSVSSIRSNETISTLSSVSTSTTNPPPFRFSSEYSLSSSTTVPPPFPFKSEFSIGSSTTMPPPFSFSSETPISTIQSVKSTSNSSTTSSISKLSSVNTTKNNPFHKKRINTPVLNWINIGKTAKSSSINKRNHDNKQNFCFNDASDDDEIMLDTNCKKKKKKDKDNDKYEYDHSIKLNYSKDRKFYFNE